MLSLAVPRWKRVTEGRRPKDRSVKGFTRISQAGNPKRPLPNCQSRADCFINATPSRRPDAVVWAPRGWAGPLTTPLRGLWVSGYLLRAMADREQGRRPENRPGGDDSDPRLASRRDRGLTATCEQKVLSNQRGLRQRNLKGRDPKTLERAVKLSKEMSLAEYASRVPMSFGSISVSLATRCPLRLQPEFHFCCPSRDCIMSIFLDDGTPCDCRAPSVNDVGRFSELAC